ncbi:hypothetical protein AK812_SmicGene36819 [Symbiodinium microadriaticum]|uniref:Uncharacterized protein n=1 Tax=Symbiodinium microadriaticum TaxID=2951 RepID=A0A1Q9CHY6_SYMMI|nr:hypothetical protein AK812_SmicGene36819 [Symbiodinium microadriaticum]
MDWRDRAIRAEALLERVQGELQETKDRNGNAALELRIQDLETQNRNLYGQACVAEQWNEWFQDQQEKGFLAGYHQETPHQRGKMGDRSMTPSRRERSPTPTPRGGAAGSSTDRTDHSTAFGDGHDTMESIIEETLNVVPGIDDDPDDMTPWAANLTFPDLMDLARTIKRDLNDQGHEDRKRDGWKGPVGMGNSARTVLHNVRFWWRPHCHEQPHPFTCDRSLRTWLKTVLLFEPGSIRIMLRDAPMQAQVPSMEDLLYGPSLYKGERKPEGQGKKRQQREESRGAYKGDGAFVGIKAQEPSDWKEDPITHCIDVGTSATGPWTPNGARKELQEVESPQDFALMDPSEEAITEETQLDEVLINLLRTAKIDKSYVEAAKFHRCTECEAMVSHHQPDASRPYNDDGPHGQAYRWSYGVTEDFTTEAAGQQQFEDLRDVPGEDIVEDMPVEEGEEEGPPDGLLDGPQPLSSIFEEEEGEAPAARGRSRSPPPVTTARSRRVSVAEPDAEQTPKRRISRAELLDDLPASIRARFEERRVEEEANVSIRKKFTGFWSNRLATQEQVEQELKELPESLKYWNCTPSVRAHSDGSRAKEWKKYEDFQESGDRIRAALAEVYGFGSRGPDWEQLARSARREWLEHVDQLITNANLSWIQDHRASFCDFVLIFIFIIFILSFFIRMLALADGAAVAASIAWAVSSRSMFLMANWVASLTSCGLREGPEAVLFRIVVWSTRHNAILHNGLKIVTSCAVEGSDDIECPLDA